MAEGFDYEMEDLGQRYSKYDDININQLNKEYDSLDSDSIKLFHYIQEDEKNNKIVDEKKINDYIKLERKRPKNS